MFCRKCGMDNPNEAKFCRGCGQALGSIVESGTKENQGGVANTTMQTGAEKLDISKVINKIKTIPKSILIGTIVCIATLIAVIGIVTNAASTIHLDEYVKIEATGYDGYGTVNATIDWEAIEEKYGEKISYQSKAHDEYGELLAYSTPIDTLKDYVELKLNKTNDVSNGDIIDYTWEVEQELTKYIKCKLKYEGGNYTVSGLQEVGTFDAFASVRVSFSGKAPVGKATVECGEDVLGYSDFVCSETSNLSNGDSVTVSIKNKEEEYYARKYGMIPHKYEKEYVVSGLEEYVSSYSKITNDYISELKSEAEDTIYAYVANKYYSTSLLTDVQYSGYIFRFVKDVDAYNQTYNDLYLIYSGTVSSSEGKFDTAKVYFPVRFTNILSGDTGFSYYDNAGISGYSKLSNSWIGTDGYINPVLCYIEIAEEYAEDYVIEAGDGFEKYAEYELITGLNDISNVYKAILQKNALQQVLDYIASDYSEESVVSDLKVLGEYLLISKKTSIDLASNNKYIVVCSATLSNIRGKFDKITVYYPVEFDGIAKLSEDEYILSSTKGILGDSRIPDSWYYTDGYVSGTEMYSKVVTAYRDEYKYEVSDSLKEFGE